MTLSSQLEEDKACSIEKECYTPSSEKRAKKDTVPSTAGNELPSLSESDIKSAQAKNVRLEKYKLI